MKKIRCVLVFYFMFSTINGEGKEGYEASIWKCWIDRAQVGHQERLEEEVAYHSW